MLVTDILVILLPLLPQEQSFEQKSIKVPSYGSLVGHLKGSSGTHYVYRFEKSNDPKLFSWDYNVSRVASLLDISPKLLAHDDNHGCMVFEHVKTKKWPSYEEDATPYHECMRHLRNFHDRGSNELQSLLSECPHEPYFPFSEIKNITEVLKQGEIPVPSQYFHVSELVSDIFTKLQPWIEKNAVLAHHDFCINNCLLSKDRTYIIDWTSAAPLGDPYHDVASFVNIFKNEQRFELLKTYLGKNSISAQEYAHFRLLELVSMARIAACCFYDQRKAKLPGNDTEKASIIKNMEMQIDSKELSGISFKSVPYSIDAEQLRMRALLSLQEFLDESKDLPSLLEDLYL